MTDIPTLKSHPESAPGIGFFSAVSSGYLATVLCNDTVFHDERGSSVTFDVSTPRLLSHHGDFSHFTDEGVTFPLLLQTKRRACVD